MYMRSCCFALALSAFVSLDAAADGSGFFVAPNGNDAWSGGLAAPDPGGSDGPWATLAGARDNLRRMKQEGRLAGPVTVTLGGGNYFVAAPIVFTPEDSGTASAPVSFVAHEGEQPVIHGGRVIGGWKLEGNFWTADLPDAAGSAWKPMGLWVNGVRRTPARTPNATHDAGDYPTDADFFFQAGQVTEKNAEGQDIKSNTKFVYKSGDLQSWPRLADAWVVVFHSWATSLLPVKALDEANQVVEFAGPARWPFGDWRKDQNYYVEHLFEGLDQPGEWFWDRAAGKMYYLPMPGEDMTTAEVVAPVAEQLLVLQGDPANNAFVEHLKFRGLTFAYTNFVLAPEGISDPQAAFSVQATVQATGARSCDIERCTVTHTGNYGVWWRSGCQDNRLFHCEIGDLGAGGVRIGEGSDPAVPEGAAFRNVVDNNYIHDGGRLFREAVGVWIGRSSFNTVSHNEIADFRYTGVSVGWSWGYAESSANHNIIEYNHIHEIGKRQLNDMGGIYTLGISPGTVLRNNLIHDVLSNPKLYGGWGLYTDEGSSNILLENNVVYNTQTGGFHQHYGKDNCVRNNVFAYSHTPQIIRSREEEHNSFLFERNIVYFNNGQLLGSTWKNGHFELDYNCYWDTSDMPLDFAGRTWEEWRNEGHDTHGIIADPGFVAPQSANFALRADTAALKLGFRPIDVNQAGLYGEQEWVAKPKQVKRAPFRPPVPPAPMKLSENFDALAAGAQMPGASTLGETDAAQIRVSADTAVSAPNSLKFVDAPGLTNDFDPHLVLHPGFRSGVARVRYQIRLEPGAALYHQWRDGRQPYSVGPDLWFEADGSIKASGQVLLQAPPQTWIEVEIACRLGKGADGTYDVNIKVPGKAEVTVNAIPCPTPGFNRLDWLGFVPLGPGNAVVYLDDLEMTDDVAK